MPNTLDYVYDEMRQHIRLMFTNNHLIPFPAKPTTKIRCLIVESDWERLSIDRATELQPRKSPNKFSDTPSVTIDNDSFNANHKSPLTSAHVKEKLIVPETDMLNEDHICTFGELLRRESSSTFNMQSTLYLYTLHLNNGCLNEDQKNYLIKLYPFKPPVVFAAVHQQRVGSVDCGVFAIAYATSLYFNTMPNTLDYVYDEMRQHIRLMFTNNHLIPFPAKPTTKIRCLIVESDWDRLLIDRAAELQPRINNTNEQHFSATSDIDYAHDVLTTFQFKINDERQVINREKEHLKRKSLVTNANCLNKKIYYDHSLNVNKESERDLMLDSNNCNPQHQLSFTSDKLSSIDINTVHLQESQKNNMTHKAVCSEHYLGKMNHLCQHCEAKHFKDEQIQGKKNSYNDCCSHGGVNLQSKDYPHELRILLDGSHPKSVHFIKHIRCYNSSFAFASFHANIVDFNSRRRGPYCFKIQGQIYYQINNALYPETGVDPNFGQLFIYDADDAVQYRLNYNDNLDSEILYSIESVMRTHNAFTKSFKMMKEVIDIETELARASNQKVPELKLLFTLKKGMDRRRYNFQRVDEVAAIFNTNSEGEVPESYVTVHNKATKELQLVSSLDPNVEPWIYPIYYPYGVEGYNINMIRSDSHQRRKKVRISRAAFIKYKIAIRDKEFNPFLHGGRLFQQWLVDNAVKNEKDKLSFCANNQSQLRCESYKGLIDHMQNVSNENEMHIGKMVILPSTFIGSPRNMMQQYQDAMAIVRNHGKPDLFITMTCNPQWTEIQENLLPNQTASDRPDIVARVFSSKVNHLIEIIVRQRLFGDVKSFVYVIEFQKRGLPHIHMLVILKENSKILSPESVDHFISAEIPDENINSTLHKIIMQNNIHGPCGDWCLVDGKCSKHFPKDFQDDTIMGDNSYVLYRRRDTGKTYERPNGYIVDNRHVVPYCPVLSQIFNCHINVEIVSSIKSVKYLYKYIYKGHDAASIIITNVDGQNSIDYNEIRHYEENRYVGPVEAVWRILSKPLAKKSHSVNRLPIHLPNEQNVIIREGQENREISFLLEKKTKLLDYFDLNKRDSNAHRYYYSEIPEHYTWISDSLEWRPRKRFDNIIGRIYSVSPSQIELFHLRLLLLTTKGATSFKDLKSVDGVIHETFTSACLALGLIEDDHEWVRTIEEAAVWMMPQLLRRLFVRILIHCNPVEPNELWERFKGIMSEDYRGIESVEAENKAYRDIKTLLSNEGYRLTDFQGLLDIEDEQNISEKNNDYNVQRHIILGNEKYMQLNVKQKIVVDYVLKSVHDSVTSNCRCIYVDGPGGSGKTFLYNTLWHLLRSRGKNVCNMAFTGIAATLLPNGKTVHKILGLPVPLYSDSSSSIKVQSKEGTFLKGTDVFIWDEAPMAPKYALEIMDRLLRDVMKSNEPFGGKVLILGGDFRQTLPIKERGTRSEIVNLSIKNSKVWKHFKKFNLSENMRVLPEETAFTDFLLKVGNGELNDINDNIELPEKIIQEGNVDIVDDVYGDLIRENRYQEIAKCAILAPRNVDVDEINKRVVQLLKSDKEKIYKSIDSTENCDNGDFNDVILPEYLNGLSPPVLPPHELHLRIHSVVMLIRNLSINEGLCNGTRLLILDLLNNLKAKAE
ncbi:uncharacterized protein LOC122509746 [Leptopilina heterotoma]|uniref:uncharacterized protein LOC122509746 n=1 Tax=Leptopilina heterotoma TaxID=63436 RepID=UPI001CA8C48D|nr:uncharacterized protein LOC122509746 [Leptopilina heterotoma]